MVEIVWTEPALNDLDAIADYIALDKPEAARELVQRIFGKSLYILYVIRSEHRLTEAAIKRRDAAKG